MGLAASIQSINYLAVVVAALISFMLGAIWYNLKVFGTV